MRSRLACLSRLWCAGIAASALLACAQQSPATITKIQQSESVEAAPRAVALIRTVPRNAGMAARQFVRGVTAVESSQWAEAQRALSTLKAQDGIPEDYRLYYLSLAHQGLQQWAGVTTHCDALIAGYPNSRFAPECAYAAARGALGQAQLTNALKRCQTALADADQGRAQRRRWEKLHADIVRTQGEHARAAQLYHQLYSDARYMSEIDIARAALVQLPANVQPFGRMTTAQRLRLSQDFIDRGAAGEAVRLLKPVAAQSAMLREQLAWAHFKAREYPQARDLFASIAEQGSVTMNRLLVLQRYATAAARAQDPVLAVSMQQRIQREFPGTDSAVSAQYKEAWLQQDSGECVAAEKTFTAWRKQSKRRQGRDASALWHMGWCAYQQQAWLRAHGHWAKLRELTPAAQQGWSEKVRYWQGRALQRAGKTSEARATWTALAEDAPKQFHGMLAAQRVQGSALDGLFTQRGISSAPKRMRIAGVETNEAAMALRDIGLWDLAIAEYDAELGEELTFAARHQEAMHSIAALRQLHTPLVKALIRQESAYKPRVVSPVGAIGLMQLMPATAQRVAQEMGRPPLHESQLSDPLTNMQLGMWYFEGLMKRYDSVVPYALAAYNAGEDAVDRWKQQHANVAMDEFIESIPFTETRKYVQRILQHYWASTR